MNVNQMKIPRQLMKTNPLVGSIMLNLAQCNFDELYIGIVDIHILNMYIFLKFWKNIFMKCKIDEKQIL